MRREVLIDTHKANSVQHSDVLTSPESQQLPADDLMAHCPHVRINYDPSLNVAKDNIRLQANRIRSRANVKYET
jgi:hypothetical protein